MRTGVLLVGLALVLAPAALPANDAAILATIREAARPIDSPDDLMVLFERIGDARYVLLGESTHGTSEFYTWRAAISRRLIAEHGFSFLVVEGDWDTCYALNRYVKDLPGAGATAREVLRRFDRWPQWMWANEEIVELAEWLREFNAGRADGAKIGFYGMDVQNPEGSLHELNEFLQASEAEVTGEVSALIAPFAPYAGSARSYTQALVMGHEPLGADLEKAVSLMRAEEASLAGDDPRAYFNAKQNALILKRSERYYRAMLSPGADSWNTRADHFHATVNRLMDYYGSGARAVVWAHNTHIGDARATPMATSGSRNIGQLLREQHGEEAVVLVGFGTHRGRVLAGDSWGSPMRRMTIPEAPPGTYEYLFNCIGYDAALLVFTPEHREGPMAAQRGHRAIGVVYNPRQEYPGNYVPTVMPQRYDAFIFIAETENLTPLEN
jgi:erythromycin esterase